MGTEHEESIRAACEEAGCIGFALTVRESNAIIALAKRIEADKALTERVRVLEEALRPFAENETISEMLDAKPRPYPQSIEDRLAEMERRKAKHDGDILRARIAELEAQLRDMPTIAYMAGAADQRDADRRANPKPPSP